MELRELRSLAALAESGSITLTANQLCLSPGAVHKQLKTLEQELGVKLYERVGRRLQLTQATEVLLPYVKELMAQHDSALAALEEWRGMKRGLVRIGAGPTLSSYILPQLLKKFRRAHPAVELTVETGNTPVLLESLNKGTLDLALLVSSDLMESPSVQVLAYWEFELVLVSHRPHPLSPCHLADLKSMPFILFRKGSRMEEPIDRYFAANGLQARVIMRMDSAEAIKALIRTGFGISMLPSWIVTEDLKAHHLSLIRQKDPPLKSKIALVGRNAAFVPQTVQAFCAEARAMEWKSPWLSAGISQPPKRK